jgi:hypothetical protein
LALPAATGWAIRFAIKFAIVGERAWTIAGATVYRCGSGGPRHPQKLIAARATPASPSAGGRQRSTIDKASNHAKHLRPHRNSGQKQRD